MVVILDLRAVVDLEAHSGEDIDHLVLCDGERMKDIFREYQPEIVFHLAAQPLVRLSYDIPVETYQTNVMGTINILEAIRETDSVKVGVMITTDKCYENREQIWGYRENEPMVMIIIPAVRERQK